MNTDRSFHHVGVACEDLGREKVHWHSLGYVDEAPSFEDPKLGISGLFLVGAGPRIELVSPLGEHSDVLTPWLGRGIKMYHLAFEVIALPRALSETEAEGGRVVVSPVPAVAFGGRSIAFCLLRNLMLIEFIQK
jgi:methylmalonyl-CoA/ethylmalonyl-CoA epimerase